MNNTSAFPKVPVSTRICKKKVPVMIDTPRMLLEFMKTASPIPKIIKSIANVKFLTAAAANSIMTVYPDTKPIPGMLQRSPFSAFVTVAAMHIPEKKTNNARRSCSVANSAKHGLPHFFDARAPDMVADEQASAKYGVDKPCPCRRMGDREFGRHRCDV